MGIEGAILMRILGAAEMRRRRKNRGNRTTHLLSTFFDNTDGNVTNRQGHGIYAAIFHNFYILIHQLPAVKLGDLNLQVITWW